MPHWQVCKRKTGIADFAALGIQAMVELETKEAIDMLQQLLLWCSLALP